MKKGTSEKVLDTEPIKKKVGRPSKTYDKETAKQIIGFLQAGCDQLSIANGLEMSVNTMKKYYSKEIKKGSSTGKMNLLRKGYDLAMGNKSKGIEPNIPMLQFMLKNVYCISDKTEIVHGGEINSGITINFGNEDLPNKK